MHVAKFADVPVTRGHRKLIGIEHGARLVQRPGKVVAVVIEIDIGILRGIEATAVSICHHPVEPRDNLLRRSAGNPSRTKLW